jgi:hypothetical protein
VGLVARRRRAGGCSTRPYGVYTIEDGELTFDQTIEAKPAQ